MKSSNLCYDIKHYLIDTGCALSHAGRIKELKAIKSYSTSEDYKSHDHKFENVSQNEDGSIGKIHNGQKNFFCLFDIMCIQYCHSYKCARCVNYGCECLCWGTITQFIIFLKY